MKVCWLQFSDRTLKLNQKIVVFFAFSKQGLGHIYELKRIKRIVAGTNVLLISKDCFRPDRDGYVKIVMGNVKSGKVSWFLGKVPT